MQAPKGLYDKLWPTIMSRDEICEPVLDCPRFTLEEYPGKRLSFKKLFKHLTEHKQEICDMILSPVTIVSIIEMKI